MGSLRTLRSYADASNPSASMGPPQPSLGPAFVAHSREPSSTQGMIIPMAFLDLDLVILKANTAFNNLMGGTVRGLRLSDIASPLEGDSFQSARNSLRAEREAKEPAYLPPIAQPGLNPATGITDQDVDGVTRGFDDQHYTWTFRLAAGEQTLPVRARLAKTSAFFIVLFLPAFPDAHVAGIPAPVPVAAQHTQHASLPPVPPPPLFHESPPRQFTESFFTSRDVPRQTSSSPVFCTPQSLYSTARAPPSGPTPFLPPRNYPQFETQPRYYTQPSQPQYQQAPYYSFQPPLPLHPLQSAQERPSTSGSASASAGSGSSPFLAPSAYFQTYTSARPRSDTLESLGRHIHNRLRADSGVTAASAVQSSSAQPSGDDPRSSSGESAESAHHPSPRKRRRMNLDEVLH